MDRRSFLQITGATAVAGVPMPSGAEAAGGPQVIQTPWPTSDVVLGPLASRLSRRLATIAAMERAGPLADALTSQTAQLMLAPADQRTDIDPALYLAAPLPLGLGLAPDDHIAWLAVGGGQPLWDEIGRRAGFKPLAVAYAGSRPGLWSRQPLDGPDALRGKSVAILGLAARALKGVGARVVSPFQIDIAAALSDGSLDAAEPLSLEHAASLGLAGVASHVAFEGAGSDCLIALHVPLAIWDGMSATQRDFVEAVAAHELQISLGSARAHEALLRQMIAATPTLAMQSLDSALYVSLERELAAVIDAITVADPLARQLHDSIAGFRALTAASGTIHGAAPVG